jgi:hypothetical protein
VMYYTACFDDPLGYIPGPVIGTPTCGINGPSL